MKTYPFLQEAPRREHVLGSEGVAPRIPNLGTRWRSVVSLTPRPLYSRGKSPRHPLDRKMGGPQSRSGEWRWDKIPLEQFYLLWGRQTDRQTDRHGDTVALDRNCFLVSCFKNC